MIVTDIGTLTDVLKFNHSNISPATNLNTVYCAFQSEICVAMVAVAVSWLPHKRRVFRSWRAISTFRLRDRWRAGTVSRTASLCARHSAVCRLCVHQCPCLTLPYCKSLVWPPADCHCLWWWRRQWRVITCDSSIFIGQLLQRRQLSQTTHVGQKNAPHYFSNNFVKPHSVSITFGTYVLW